MHWLEEVFKTLAILIHYIRSEKQAADVFTKDFLQLEPWIKLCNHIGVFDPASFKKIILSVAVTAQVKLFATVVLAKQATNSSPKTPPKAPAGTSAVGHPPPMAKAMHNYPPPPPGPPIGSTTATRASAGIIEVLTGTSAAVRAEAMFASALGSSATRRVVRPPVGEPEGMPETTPEEAHIHHTVHSGTTIALTGANLEAICLSLVTV